MNIGGKPIQQLRLGGGIGRRHLRRQTIGPRMLMYGLTAVCNKARPLPITNKPVSAPGYQRWVANWPNSAAPTAITSRLNASPRFMPVRARIHDDGSARQK
jgi:hypothetical protein